VENGVQGPTHCPCGRMQTSEQLPSFTDTPEGFMTDASALDLVESEPLLEQLLEVLLQAVATYSLRHADCTLVLFNV